MKFQRKLSAAQRRVDLALQALFRRDALYIIQESTFTESYRSILPWRFPATFLSYLETEKLFILNSRLYSLKTAYLDSDPKYRRPHSSLACIRTPNQPNVGLINFKISLTKEVDFAHVDTLFDTCYKLSINPQVTSGPWRHVFGADVVLLTQSRAPFQVA